MPKKWINMKFDIFPFFPSGQYNLKPALIREGVSTDVRIVGWTLAHLRPKTIEKRLKYFLNFNYKGSPNCLALKKHTISEAMLSLPNADPCSTPTWEWGTAFFPSRRGYSTGRGTGIGFRRNSSHVAVVFEGAGCEASRFFAWHFRSQK